MYCPVQCSQSWPHEPELSPTSYLNTTQSTTAQDHKIIKESCDVIYSIVREVCCLTGKSAGVSEGPDLRVSESHQPDDEGVQHILIKQNAVLTLLHDLLQEL